MTPSITTSMAVTTRPIAIAMVVLLGSCQQPGLQTDPTADLADKETSSLQKISETESTTDNHSVSSVLGQVTAEVTLQPKNPQIGDLLTLKLEVTAPQQKVLTMPKFGEALGRFVVQDFHPSQVEKAGKRYWRQSYVLQSPPSGLHRIPQLRIGFTDDSLQQRELLTDEISFRVRSVIPEGEIAPKLKPAPGTLPLSKVSTGRITWLLLAVGGLVLGLIFLVRRKSTRRSSSRENPFAIATKKLSHLQARGMPEAEQTQAWYVELSTIVREYIEGRFAIRAPELTTEEFLTVANQSKVLTAAHRTLLRDFLASCDKVKFARHTPVSQESTMALENALRFVTDTKPVEDAP